MSILSIVGPQPNLNAALKTLTALSKVPQTATLTVTAIDAKGQMGTAKTIVMIEEAYMGWKATIQNPAGRWVPSGFDNRTFRVVLKGSAITQSGQSVQVVLRGRPTGEYTVQNVSLVQRVGATLNGVGPVTPVTFKSGASSVTVPAGETVTSDPMAFNLVAGQDVFLTFWAPPGAGGVYRDGGPVGEDTAWMILAKDHTATRDWGGLLIGESRNYLYNIERMEVVAPDPVPDPMVWGLTIPERLKLIHALTHDAVILEPGAYTVTTAPSEAGTEG